MHIMSKPLRFAAISAIAFSTVHAVPYVIDNLSFGHKDTLSPNGRGIPHWNIQGNDDWLPQLFSDRIILTPPYPGNKRGSIWTEDALQHKGDWVAQVDFRASGQERGAGNLQIWYVKQSQAREPPTSLYTAHKFDGLVLVLDQYENHGGSLRGFLNDGTIDIGAHPDPDTLAFGKCDYAYRNRGQLTPIKLHHAEGFLEVIVDGETCFKTDKVILPEGYYFGISASSAENPDSFEVHKFTVTTTYASPHEPAKDKGDYAKASQQHQQNLAAQQSHDQQQQQQQQQTNQQQQQQQKFNVHANDIPKMLEDVVAANIQSQQDQFADLHNRIQIINSRVYEIHEMVELIHKTNHDRWTDLMARVVPIDDRSAATIRNVEKVERQTAQILKDLESKDFKDMMKQIHAALTRSHDGVLLSMPDIVGSVVQKHGPSMMTIVFIAVAAQIMVTGAYLVYKKRRGGAPKKYL